jgi:hypothetical protein
MKAQNKACQACLTRDPNNARTIEQCPAEVVPSWYDWESEFVSGGKRSGGLNPKWPLTWGAHFRP